jgi:hypothetical protein
VSLRNEAQRGSDAKDRRGRSERRRSEAARGEAVLCSTGAGRVGVGTERADVRQQERRSERKGCHGGQEERTSGGGGAVAWWGLAPRGEELLEGVEAAERGREGGDDDKRDTASHGIGTSFGSMGSE